MSAGAWRSGAAVCIGAAAALCVLWANQSPLLPGLHSDGVQYLESALSLSRLEPPTIPIAHWSSPAERSMLAHYPPGLPAAIAVPVALGADAMTGAALVNALSAGATLALVFLLGCELANLAGGLLSATLVGFYHEWMRVHVAVWSEPLYLALLAAALLAMVRRPERAGWHGALALACTAVRYVGVSVAVASAIVAYRGAESAAQARRRALLAVAPSVLFLAIWTSFAAAEGSAARHLALNPGMVRWIASLPGVLVRWAAPAGGVWVGVVVLTLVALVLARSELWSTQRGRSFGTVALAVVGTHLLVLAASRAVADQNIPMDARMLLPATLVLSVAAGACLAGFARSGALPRVATLVAVAAWSAAGAVVVADGVEYLKANGLFYTHRMWAESAPVEWARTRSDESPTLYSNEPELLFLYTGRPAREIPTEGEDLEAWRRAWRERPGALVLMNPAEVSDLPAQLLAEGLDLTPVAASPEGVVLWR